MLTVTESAVTAISTLTTAQDLPAGSGLRISAHGEALRVSVTPHPQEGDAVFNASGALVFMDRDAVQQLDGKRLDAQMDGDGGVRFAVDEPAS
ncbi:adhesin [Asanoa sp. NPDC049518]|uniref:adhesin n=1 Tax=unclassified Asanoa TaxID=2685164 RepID=UPI003435CB69